MARALPTARAFAVVRASSMTWARAPTWTFVVIRADRRGQSTGHRGRTADR